MAGATVIYHSNRIPPVDLELAGAMGISRNGVEWRPAAELLDGPGSENAADVLIVDDSMLERADLLPAVPTTVVVIAADPAAAKALGARMDLSAAGLEDAVSRARLLGAACQLAESRAEVARMRRQVARTDHEFHELSRIGIALMHERDRTALLHLILAQGKQLTESDGGGLLLLETDEHGVADLRPMAYEFDSLPGLRVPRVRFPLDNTSVVGHAALTEEPVVIADINRLPASAGFGPSAEFQAKYRYHGRSMLAVPMLDGSGRVLGVLFFINRKSEPGAVIRTEEDCDRYVLSYTDREVRLARSLASQAAVSIENTRLHMQIERILESIIKAAVTGIDDRDPATAGHSVRVAAIATRLADAVGRADRGPYRDVRFNAKQMRELRFAALLHDVGKITVREDVLTKAKKLPPLLWERIDARFDFIRRTIQLEDAERRAAGHDAAAAGGGSTGSIALADRLNEVDRLRAIVRAANEPSMVDTPPVDVLREIASRTFQRADGTTEPYVTPYELHYLELVRGTLDEHERAEAEGHVERTYRFLVHVPWTDDLKNLAEYAYGHHEKLNGSGYPRGLRDEEIPLQTRIITLADIFDALTEADRPYKPAVTAERALDIIRGEVDAGLLDRGLVDIFVESQVYRRSHDEDERSSELAAGSQGL